uniref:Uncharacterized protein n=1 Tax=Arundo donax TaxID=35708 RepID=A0A0A9BYV5_ARUDO
MNQNYIVTWCTGNTIKC